MRWSLKNGYSAAAVQGVYFLEKYDEMSKSVALGQQLRYFTDQNGPQWGPHEN